MPVQLNHIIIFNFKSFRGEVIIGPVKPFTAIIGANGSGKSNIMDAISFVMGEKARNLRVKQFTELIYGAPGGVPIEHRAYVTAVFVLEDKSFKSFTRSICHNSCEYKIDDQVVIAQLYISELKKLNLNINAKNFLIFQGAIDSITTKTPKEYTHMFEEISNSIELKEEYERLKNEVIQAENEIQYLYKIKKDLLRKKRYSLSEKKEADKYEQLHDQFDIIQDVQDLQITLRAIELKAIEYENDKNSASNLLREQKNQLQLALDTMENIGQIVTEVENDLGKKEANLIQVKEKVTYWEQKINATKLILLEAQKSNKSHVETIQELENELRQIEHAKFMFEENMSTQLLSRGSSFELNDIQVKEYFSLKQVAEVQCLENVQACNSLKREQSINQNKLDNENRKRYKLEPALQQKIILKDETEKRIRNIQQLMNETQNTLIDKTSIKCNLESMIIKRREDVESIQQELQCVSDQLESVKINKSTTLRLKKGAETIKILQSLFSGVYGRLYNLCKPVHPRYDVAMTKVLGKYCNSIIVSTNQVALECINYLKRQQIGTEIFLPVESLKVESIKEKLRKIENPQNVKLLYDVLRFEPAEINNAILFVTKNTLVCETSEDARILAYEIDPRRNNNCVALDGTYYTKSGIISGGQVELLEKAKIWNEQNLVQLKSKKTMLMAELRDKTKTSQNEFEAKTLDVQIQGLTSRLNYCKLDLNDAASENKIITLRNEIEDIQNKLRIVDNNITSIKNIMAEKNQDIQNIEESIKNIEDMIFKEFCNKVGIRNIRQYEQENLKFHQEQTKKKLELEEQYSRIQNLLDFERSRNTESLVTKTEQNLVTAKRELEKVRRTEALHRDMSNHGLNKLNNLRTMHNKIKLNVNERTEKLKECRRNISTIAKLIINTEKELIMVTTSIKRKKAKCHTLLLNSKVEDINIPLLSGQITNSIDTSDSTPKTEERHDVDFLLHIDFKLKNQMELVKDPNFKANKEIEFTIEKLSNANFEYQDARKKLKIIKRQFELVKQERYERFTTSLEHITTNLDSIIKCLVKDKSAQAILFSDNSEEPYLGEINYSCVMPGKRFQSFSNLSGGEKTLATIAFLFAIHSFRPAPFFILDEIDAALDNINIKNVIRLIYSKMNQMQFIIITLKEEMYSCADALIGVCSDNNGEYPESSVFTLSLKEYMLKI
ncbi:PREDICTED: structural maintenance of chromosomes protein 1A-like [Eufriesea mexicana]|uniref:structural maintenance of chromosomes protein 1A-like n=1 Tax=Eufriesea mexicana TaxID=516756 RepID=UPI00083BEC9D|nr:PREDICTED: structural maintenance of chromosomes protein 1A-like [Eufriesea mexicana]